MIAVFDKFRKFIYIEILNEPFINGNKVYQTTNTKIR